MKSALLIFALTSGHAFAQSTVSDSHAAKTMALQEANITELKSAVKSLTATIKILQTKLEAVDAAASGAQRAAVAAQSQADTANTKSCYLTSHGHGHEWGQCPFGGIYRGGITPASQMSVAGVNSENVWQSSIRFWMCCT